MTATRHALRRALTMSLLISCLVSATGCRDSSSSKPPSGAPADVAEPDIQVGSESPATSDDSEAAHRSDADGGSSGN